MTLINLSKTNTAFIFQRTFVLLAGAALCVGVWFVYEYNQLVDTKFEIKRLKESMEKLLVVNAELKVRVHDSIAPNKLDEVAGEFGLVKEASPRYYAQERDVVSRARVSPLGFVQSF